MDACTDSEHPVNAPDDNVQDPDLTGNIVPTSYINYTVWNFTGVGYTGEQCGHLWRNNSTSINHRPRLSVRVVILHCAPLTFLEWQCQCVARVPLEPVEPILYFVSRILTQESWMCQDSWHIPDLIFRREGPRGPGISESWPGCLQVLVGGPDINSGDRVTAKGDFNFQNAIIVTL